MSDVLLYSFMALVVFMIVVAIVQGAQNSYKPNRPVSKQSRNYSRPTTRTQRAQEVWNRLNPNPYLDDEDTQPMLPLRIHED
jgi:hypothetical protein